MSLSKIVLYVILLSSAFDTLRCLNVIKSPNFRNNPSSIPVINPTSKPKIVLIAGFEAFNIQLYRNTAKIVHEKLPYVTVTVLTDMDICDNPNLVEDALGDASVVICSLIFDYNQVNWLQERIQKIPTRFMFECAQELMSLTNVGGFVLKPADGNKAGPPPVVKNILKQFGSSNEEDKMAGYLQLLKVGPKLLKMIPSEGPIGDKINDLRTWITVYSYWNQGGLQNIVSMMYYIIDECSLNVGVDGNTASDWTRQVATTELVETPTVAFYHPKLYATNGYVENAKTYNAWYLKSHPWVTDDTPRVGLLLYRKHVLSEQAYIGNLITLMESQELMPVPVFISGVEAHIVVRDMFVTRNEVPSAVYVNFMSGERVLVDAVVNTIGFPLVGGPAGSMEGGRQIDASREILTAKNVPYIVAAPLLIQDMESWKDRGVQGLQTVILYSLPELDGAVDTVVIGGLVDKDQIVVLPERVRKLTNRLKSWIHLSNLPAVERKIAILVYGFPPNVGAVGTAALLNVARSLRNVLIRLSSEGYFIGNAEFIDSLNSELDAGEKLIRILSSIARNGVAKPRIQNDITNENLPDVSLIHEEVTCRELQSWLGKSMSAKMVKQWGDLETYTGLGTSGTGKLLIQGLQVGNVFLGMQPLLGVEGDPMRLLFERDLTPHPQYAAYYLWLQKRLKPNVLLHFGMHGTVEWLPGNPLGNTPESWPDMLLGDMPNLYVYACNNPSESILAKRRGYATIVSHNVPPYSRAGLYNELKQLQGLISDYREAQTQSQTQTVQGLIPLVVSVLERAGLFADLPYTGAGTSTNINLDQLPQLTVDGAEALLAGPEDQARQFVQEFSGYLSTLTEYLSELELKLFSEGLHEFGAPHSAKQIEGYLQAVTQICSSGSSDAAQTISATTHAQVNATEVLATISRAAVAGKTKPSALAEALHTACNPNRYDKHAPNKAFAEWPQVSEDLFGLTLLRSGKLGRFVQYSAARALTFLGSDSAENDVNNVILDSFPPTMDRAELLRAVDLSRALNENSEHEMRGLLNGLAGKFVPAAPGGDIIRDGAAVLPTGRNIYSLDPYRIPSPVALLRGKQAADQVLDAHRKANKGQYPETVAVTLWGLDTIKTKGESVGIILRLVGAEPVQEATGRIVSFRLVPLEQLGRPRIDVLASLSGIFRDSFENVMDLLDRLFEAAATADEPPEMNFIKKHSADMQGKGIERTFSRLFSNAPGDFGSMVNERVGSGEWEESTELGDTWQRRNAFSYGGAARGERGAAREEVLRQLLNTTDRIVQEIDCVEYGLTDIQEYYANTGALKKAAENNRDLSASSDPSTGSRRSTTVSVSVIEATERAVRPRELEEVLRMEYRSKLLNPRWSEAMLKQGAGGAYEISGRLTAMIGWASTAGFCDKWVFDQTAEKYALDSEMAAKLKELNPEAFRNVLKRLLEASGRGFWAAEESTLQRLQELYEDAEDEIEGV